MANLTIPIQNVPGTDSQQGSRQLGAIKRGAIKFVPIFYYVLRMTYLDFKGAGAVLTVKRVVSTQWPNKKFPANVHPLENPGPVLDLEEVFAGGTIASCVLSAGSSSDTDGILEGTNVFTGAGTGIKNGKNDTGTDLYDFQSALDLNVEITTTTGNLDELTTGIATLYVPCTAVPRSKA